MRFCDVTENNNPFVSFMSGITFESNIYVTCHVDLLGIIFCTGILWLSWRLIKSWSWWIWNCLIAEACWASHSWRVSWWSKSQLQSITKNIHHLITNLNQPLCTFWPGLEFVGKILRNLFTWRFPRNFW